METAVPSSEGQYLSSHQQRGEVGLRKFYTTWGRTPLVTTLIHPCFSMPPAIFTVRLTGEEGEMATGAWAAGAFTN